MQIVAYLRVSTARQGASGLGLEAQRAAVHGFASASGHVILAEYVEVESAKKAERPQLTQALATCRLHRATLVIAKLDRLARNVAFIANLMDGGVDFVACDMPHANRLTLHLMAAMAEYEREMISQRTRAALSAAKAKGVKLGNPNGARHLHEGAKAAAAISAQRRAKIACDQSAYLAAIIDDIVSMGAQTSAEIARQMNLRAIPSPGGGAWSSSGIRLQVSRLNARRGQ